MTFAGGMVRRRLFTAVVYLNLLVGCAVVPHLSCPSSEKRYVNEMLYFGTAKPQGEVNIKGMGRLSPDSNYSVIPKGFTFWQASGQWQNSSRTITRETSWVVSLVHPDDSYNEKAVVAIVNDYKLRFQQEACAAP